MADDYIDVETDADGKKHVTANSIDTYHQLMNVLDSLTGNSAYSDENAETVLAELIEKYHCRSCDGHSCEV